MDSSLAKYGSTTVLRQCLSLLGALMSLEEGSVGLVKVCRTCDRSASTGSQLSVFFAASLRYALLLLEGGAFFDRESICKDSC